MSRATPNRVGEFFKRMLHRDEAGPEPAERVGLDPAIVAMLRGLGAAMVQSGRATNDTDATLHRRHELPARPENMGRTRKSAS